MADYKITHIEVKGDAITVTGKVDAKFKGVPTQLTFSGTGSLQELAEAALRDRKLALSSKIDALARSEAGSDASQDRLDQIVMDKVAALQGATVEFFQPEAPVDPKLMALLGLVPATMQVAIKAMFMAHGAEATEALVEQIMK